MYSAIYTYTKDKHKHKHTHTYSQKHTNILRPRNDWRKIWKLKSCNSLTFSKTAVHSYQNLCDWHRISFLTDIHPLSTRNNVRKASSAICAKSRNSVDNRPGRVSWQGTGLKNIPPVLSHPCWSHISHILLGRIYEILQKRLLVCWL